MRPDSPEVLPELAGAVGVAGEVSTHGIPERLGVIGGELFGGFPYEVGELAPGGHFP